MNRLKKTVALFLAFSLAFGMAYAEEASVQPEAEQAELSEQAGCAHDYVCEEDEVKHKKTYLCLDCRDTYVVKARRIIIRKSGSYTDIIENGIYLYPGESLNLDDYYSTQTGYTTSWVYNNEEYADNTFTVPGGKSTPITLYLKYTPIDYYVRIDAGEHGSAGHSGYSLCEEQVEMDGRTMWQGRYDIEGNSYGEDDDTGEPHASKTYDHGKQYYVAVLPKPTPEKGWYFTGWTIKYYNDDFTEEINPDPWARKTSVSVSSTGLIGSSAGKDYYDKLNGTATGSILDVTPPMWGNCVITANYTNEVYVVEMPKGDDVISGNEHVSNYSREKGYRGFKTRKLSGAVVNLTTLDDVKSAAGNENISCDFDNNYYYAIPKGFNFGFYIYLSAGFNKDEFNVYANGIELERWQSYNDGTQVMYQLAKYSMTEKGIEANKKAFEDCLANSGNSIVTISVENLEANEVSIKVNDTTKKGYTVNWQDDEGCLGNNKIRWGETVHFTVEDADGNTVKEGIRVNVSTRTIYSNMERLRYHHYGKEQTAENGKYVALYPDENGVYTWNYKPNDMYANRGHIKIEEYTLEDYKEDAAKELYDFACLEYNIFGAAQVYSDLVRTVAENFWTVTLKGNLKYSGKSVVEYKGKYQKFNNTTGEFEDWNMTDEDKSEIPPFAGWATNTSIYAAYYLESSLDAAGAAVQEALFAIADAKTVPEVRAVIANTSKGSTEDSDYIRRIKAAKALGAEAYNKHRDEETAKRLEKEYKTSLETNGYSIAQAEIKDEELSEHGVDCGISAVSEEKAERVSVYFDADNFKKIADNESKLSISTDVGTLDFSAEAVKNIAYSEKLAEKDNIKRKVYINITAQKAENTPGITQAQIDAVGADRIIYDLTVTNERGGVISLGDAPVTVTVPYNAAEGEKTEYIKVWYLNNRGEAEYVGIDSYFYDESEQLFVTFTTTHFSAYVVAKAVTKTIQHSGSASRKVSLAKKTSLTLTEMEKNSPFNDVLTGHWAYEYIKSAVESGYMSADKDGNFVPSGTVTAGEFAAMLNKISGKEIVFAKNEEATLTRNELAEISYDYMKKTGYEMSDAISEVKDSDAEAVKAVVVCGIADEDSNGRYCGSRNADRAVVAKAVYMLAHR